MSKAKGKRAPNKSTATIETSLAGSGESTRPASTSPDDAITESKSPDPAAPSKPWRPLSAEDRAQLQAIHDRAVALGDLITEAEGKRQAFIDQTAIAMFARGFPLANLWTHCEKLWASREAHLKAGSK